LGAAGGESGFVSVTDLASYIDARVPELSFDVFNERQVPQMSVVGSNFPLVRQTSVLTGAEEGEVLVPGPATHGVMAAASVHGEAGGGGAILAGLPPGARVRLIEETASGWTLVARDGRRLGYVEAA